MNFVRLCWLLSCCELNSTSRTLYYEVFWIFIASDCLDYVLAHSDTFPQFADVIQGIIPSNPKDDSIQVLSG